jgi:site-specific DNA-cytosine methylase
LKTLRAIDVCCGAGGWATAARGLPIEIIAAFDQSEDCLLTYKHNHPSVTTIQCDVIDYDFSKYIGVDLVLGGIPCEQISAARRGVPIAVKTMRIWKKLLGRMLKLPADLGAPYWIYEDVVDVLRFCDAPHIILDSAHFSCQRRKRAYLGTVAAKLERAINMGCFGHKARPGPYRLNPRTMSRRPGRAEVYNSDQFYPWMMAEKSPTVIGLSSRHDNYAAAECGNGWRQLEWQELAALQGFPDDYLFVGTPSRTVKMIAQAVQIDTARALLSDLVIRAKL